MPLPIPTADLWRLTFFVKVTSLGKEILAFRKIVFSICSNLPTQEHSVTLPSSALLWELKTTTKLANNFSSNFLQLPQKPENQRHIEPGESMPQYQNTFLRDSSNIIFRHSLYPFLQSTVFHSELPVKFHCEFPVLFMRRSSNFLYLIMLLSVCLLALNTRVDW